MSSDLLGYVSEVVGTAFGGVVGVFTTILNAIGGVLGAISSF